MSLTLPDARRPESGSPLGPDDRPDPSEEVEPARNPLPWWRRRWVRRLTAVVLAVVVIVLCIARLASVIGAQGAGDPRSSTPTGSGAVAQLLSDQGVRIERTEDAQAATRHAGADTTVVVVHPDRLRVDQATSLLARRPARVVLIQPDAAGLARFGLDVRPLDGVTDVPSTLPRCSDPVALRAGSIQAVAATGYRLGPDAFGCFPDQRGGSFYLQSRRAGVRIDLVGAPFANRTLADQGNASFATGVLGSQPRVVWLMAQQQSAAAGAPPGILPRWWPAAVVQGLLALVVLGIWRGRRLGPIIAERLPVRVHASETVEGHGRLYHRLDARDRAATALRAGVCRRLGPRFGAGSGADPMVLAQLLAERTGRNPAQVGHWLAGPTPADDDALVDLAKDLDRLEQEARQL